MRNYLCWECGWEARRAVTPWDCPKCSEWSGLAVELYNGDYEYVYDLDGVKSYAVKGEN